MEFKIPDADTIVRLHEIILSEYGGLSGIPHPEYIDAAISRPQNYMTYDVHCDLHLVAAIILFSITKNHAFADGNKRTALVAMLLTYNINGVRLSYSLRVNQKFERLVLKVAEKQPPTIRQIRARLRKLVIEYRDI